MQIASKAAATLLRVVEVEGDDEEEIVGGAEVFLWQVFYTSQDNSIPQMEAANNAATRQVGDEART